MSGTRAGGLKTAAKNKQEFGEDYYIRMGRLGGIVKRPETRHFSLHPIAAREAGYKGGLRSRRIWSDEEKKIQSRRMKRYWANVQFQEGFNKPGLIERLHGKLF